MIACVSHLKSPESGRLGRICPEDGNTSSNYLCNDIIGYWRINEALVTQKYMSYCTSSSAWKQVQQYPVLESFPVFVYFSGTLYNQPNSCLMEQMQMSTKHMLCALPFHALTVMYPLGEHAVSSPARLPVLERHHQHSSTSHSRRGFPLQKEARH